MPAPGTAQQRGAHASIDMPGSRLMAAACLALAMVATAAAAAAPAPAPAAAGPSAVTLQVLHVNDLHAR